MSKLVLCVTLLFFVFAKDIVEGGVATHPDASHPDHPGKCFVPNMMTHPVSPNETYQPKDKCEAYLCNDDLSMTINTCGAAQVAEPCKAERPGDLTKKYPDCCFKIVCP